MVAIDGIFVCLYSLRDGSDAANNTVFLGCGRSGGHQKQRRETDKGLQKPHSGESNSNGAE